MKTILEFVVMIYISCILYDGIVYYWGLFCKFLTRRCDFTMDRGRRRDDLYFGKLYNIEFNSIKLDED